MEQPADAERDHALKNDDADKDVRNCFGGRLTLVEVHVANLQDVNDTRRSSVLGSTESDMANDGH